MKRRRIRLIYTACILVIASVSYLLAQSNGRGGIADFRVYYDAAMHLKQGDTPYGQAFGLSSGYFKYSPFAGLLFIPFTWLSYHTASAVWFFVIAGMVAYSGWQWSKRTHEIFTGISFLFLLISGTILFADHIDREWQLGNVNLFLLILSLFVFRLYQKQQWFYSGILYILIVLFKPHFVFLGIYFLWKFNWKFFLSALSAFCVALFLPVFWLGWTANLDLLVQWKQAMLEHNTHLYESPNTFYGLVYRYIAQPIGVSQFQWIVPVILVLVLTFYALLIKRIGKMNITWGNDYLYFMLIALIPGLTHTDTEHFIWIWPITFIAFGHAIHLVTYHSEFHHIARSKRMINFIPLTLMILAAVPFIVNTPDLVGKTFNHWYEEEGGLGFSYLFFLFISTTCFFGYWKIQSNPAA